MNRWKILIKAILFHNSSIQHKPVIKSVWYLHKGLHCETLIMKNIEYFLFCVIAHDAETSFDRNVYLFCKFEKGICVSFWGRSFSYNEDDQINKLGKKLLGWWFTFRTMDFKKFNLDLLLNFYLCISMFSDLFLRVHIWRSSKMISLKQVMQTFSVIRTMNFKQFNL